MIWPVIAIVAVAVLLFERVGIVSAPSSISDSSINKEFRAWEKTPIGAFKQVKKSYYLDEALCRNVITVLNEMSTKEPPSNWVLSHTTASTFECLPAAVTPRNATQEISEFSDEHVDTTSGNPAREHLRTPLARGATLATLDQQEKCSDQARKTFAEQGYAHKSMAGYESHYNARLNRCFVEISTTDTQISPGTIWTNRFVLDAFEGKQYATYAWHTEKDKKYWEVAPFQCEILLPSGERQFCKSDAEFDLLVNMYMQDAN